jgi:CHRD domain-containing protein
VAAAKGPLVASLTGANEVPGPGDPNGQGAAGIVMKPGKVCFGLVASDIGAPIAAHIHKGAAGTAGDPVVTFTAPFSRGPFFSAAACVKAKNSVINAILKDPAGYYVNIHTKAFAGGAIRGQLRT